MLLSSPLGNHVLQQSRMVLSRMPDEDSEQVNLLDQDESVHSSNCGSFEDEQWSDAQDTLVTDSQSESKGVDPAQDSLSSSEADDSSGVQESRPRRTRKTPKRL